MSVRPSTICLFCSSSKPSAKSGAPVISVSFQAKSMPGGGGGFGANEYEIEHRKARIRVET